MRFKFLTAIFFALFILTLFFTSQTFAQTVRVQPNYPPKTAGLYERLIKDSSYANDPIYVDGNVRTVDIVFEELPGDDDKYGACPLSDQKKCTDHKVAAQIEATSSGIIRTTVCGAGKDALKGRLFTGTSSNGKECNENKDYFHEGHIYRLGIYDTPKAEGFIGLAEFYVKHSMPWVQVKLHERKGATAVDVTLWGRRPGGEGKNNYQIVIGGIDNNLKSEDCVIVNDDSTTTYPAGYQKDPTNYLTSGPGTIVENIVPNIFGKAIATSFPPGRYVVKINERINETLAGLGVKIPLELVVPLGPLIPGTQGRNINVGRADKCQGGFTYMHIPLRIVSSTSKSQNNNSVGKIEFDPNESDAAKEFDLFQGARAVCADYDVANNTCKKVNTALGEIEVTAPGFIKTMFRFILTLAAFGSILIIIYSGYVLTTSAGNKEKIAAARETITSAVVGLLFIIFSIVILEIIGVDILRIPGLTR